MNSYSMTDGKCTVVKIMHRSGGKVYEAFGSSRRMKGDVPDPELGLLIAETRALDKVVNLMKTDVRRATRA